MGFKFCTGAMCSSTLYVEVLSRSNTILTRGTGNNGHHSVQKGYDVKPPVNDFLLQSKRM